MSKSLYIHIPFCKSKCIYCDFLSFSNKKNLINEYINYLDKEMKNFPNEDIETIFIGGGTPSILNLNEIKNFLKIIKLNFNLTNLKEFTFEANPDSLTEEKIDFLVSNDFVKVNRFSLGIQSFDDEVLKIIGRHYSFEKAEEIINFILLHKNIKINTDFILGFPFEKKSIEKRAKFLEKFIKNYKINHISLYMLTITSGTPIYDMIETKKILSLDDEKLLEEYETFSEILIKNNYIHYEISNFAYGEKNKCLHNLAYWEHKNYLGIGLGASSYDKGKRWKNPSSFEKFFEMLDQKNFNFREIEVLSINQIFYEKIFLGFRILDKGINLKEIEAFFVENNFRADFNLFLKKIDNFCKIKLLLKNENKIFLTKNGIFLSDYIIRDLIDI